MSPKTYHLTLRFVFQIHIFFLSVLWLETVVAREDRKWALCKQPNLIVRYIIQFHPFPPWALLSFCYLLQYTVFSRYFYLSFHLFFISCCRVNVGESTSISRIYISLSPAKSLHPKLTGYLYPFVAFCFLHLVSFIFIIDEYVWIFI